MLGRSGMEVTNYSFQVLLLIFYTCVVAASDVRCAPGLKTLGYTYPKGDINLEHGSPLEIFCVLDSDKYNSSALSFYINDKRVPSSFVNVVNSTTLRLFVSKPPPLRSIYSCKAHTDTNTTEGVCLNFVFIGFKPQPVTNFSCVSHNWENMNCSWIPVEHFLKTQYHLSFKLKKNSARKVFACPGNELIENYCVWNASSSPVYRQAYELYFFNMTISNAIGNLSTIYEINNYAVVVPNKPVNLSLVEATSNSLTITWALPGALRNFPRGLVHKIMYQSKWDTMNYWQVVNTTNMESKNGVLIWNITDLKYAHTLYDIRVLIKSAVAADSMWSEPGTITLRTKATVPGMPPKTDIGSFETFNDDNQRDINLYWQQIPRFMENGDNFEYKITSVSEIVDDIVIERDITPEVITKTFAKYRNLTYNSYNFTVISSNKEGYSKNASFVLVPSLKQSPPAIVTFSKIAFDSGIYELSWNVISNINSYTIFWCDNKQDRPFDCKGFLNWTKVYVNHLDAKRCENSQCGLLQKNVTLPIDKVYQFALSANTKKTSSGMVWAKCTVLPDQARGKLKNIWINNLGATFIEIKWKLDCFDMSRRIQGFQISFCPIRDPQDSTCKEPVQNVTINGGLETSFGRITKLKPYTTYMVQVAVVADNWIGLKSDPLLNTTMEAAPNSAPEQLKTLKITNTSIQLSWHSPKSLNGVLRYYLIRWNDKIGRIEDKSDIVFYELTGLESFEDYVISVSACTVACSPESVVISAKTKTGTPSRMNPPSLQLINMTEIFINVQWGPPSNPAGIVKYYEIHLTASSEEDSHHKSERFINVTEYPRSEFNTYSYSIPATDCKASHSLKHYKVSIRAVNKGEDNNLYKGPWSPPAEGNCYATIATLSVEAKILLFTVLFLALIAIFITSGCLIRCVWIRCKAMQNVGVKLPPQLELNNVFKDNMMSTDKNMSVHATPLKTIEVTGIPTPDQELLLEQKIKDLNESSIDNSEDGNNDIESSGCGSGHDSVSSSITAGTHVTDSGTEADDRPSTPDIFDDNHGGLPDNRQRNTANHSSGDGYSRLAAAPSTGYVTVPSSSSRGYVSHPPQKWVPVPVKGYVTSSPLAPTLYSKVGVFTPQQPNKENTNLSTNMLNTNDEDNSNNDDMTMTKANPNSSI